MSAEGSGMPGGGCITAGEVRPAQAERRWLSYTQTGHRVTLKQG